MADIYHDQNASGSNTGADWTNAYTDMQDALDAYAAGDAIHTRNGQTVTTGLTMTTTGTTTAPITIIGYNASGVEDGTRSTFTGSGVVEVFDASGVDFVNIRNIRFTGGTGDTVDIAATCNNWQWYNCEIDNGGGDNMDLGGAQRHHFTNCCWHDATQNGIRNASGANTVYEQCEFYDNGLADLENGGAPTMYRCTFRGAGSYSCEFNASNAAPARLIGCTWDDATSHAVTDGGTVTGWWIFANCVFTNNGGYAINNDNAGTIVSYRNCGFASNTSGTVKGDGPTYDLGGNDTSFVADYVNQGTGNLNRGSNGELIRFETTIGCLGSPTNSSYETAGQVPDAAASGGGETVIITRGAGPYRKDPFRSTF